MHNNYIPCMKHFFIATLAICVLSSASAQRTISSFKEIKITDGGSTVIDGVRQSEPDIYYISQPDGSYQAVRLTVAPTGKPAAVTKPYLNLNTHNSICINWKTDRKASGSVVRYGLSPELLDCSCSASDRAITSTYYWNTAPLENLEPNTPYYYTVESNGQQSDIYRFRTMPAPDDKTPIRVLFIGDHQRNDHSDYEWMLNAARQTVKQKYGEGPFEDNIHLLMNVGDQVDGGKIELYENVHLFKSRSISPTLCNMTAVGNHEYSGDTNLRLYDGHYRDYGNLEYQGIKSGTANYYAYQAGAVLFVVINSDDPSAAQTMWVRKIVAAASSDSNVDFIVSVQHRPLYAEQFTNDVSPWMLNEIMPILSSTPKHVLNCGGHHHLYARGQMTDTPVYHIISGGGVGTSHSAYEQLWGTTPDNFNHDEVQKTLDLWTYQIFEFDPATRQMTVETYSVGNSRLALDNELVDSFSRKTDDSSAPAVPSIIAPENNISLPYAIVQAHVSEKLHSAQYQISHDREFTSVLVDKVVTAEDFYGVQQDFRPLDLNKDLDLTEYHIAEGSLSNGTYYIRVRNRNMNLNWSDYSEPVEFTVEGASAPSEITLSSKFFRTNSTVTVNYKGAPVGKKAWVGIYKENKKPGTSDLSSKYAYTSGESGKLEFQISEPDVYFAALFKDDGYTEIAPRVYFVVSNNCDRENTPVIATDKSVYAKGEPVKVSFIHAPCIAKDWIGIYSKTANPSSTRCPTYRYVGSKSEGELTLNVSGSNNYSSALSDGIYFAGYFNADRYYEPADRAYFIIGKPAITDTDKKQYTSADRINVVYEGAPGWGDESIVVYSGGKIYSEYPAGQTGGSIVLQPLPAGDYEICLVVSDGTEISERTKISVSDVSSVGGTIVDDCSVYVNKSAIVISSAKGVNNVEVFSVDGIMLHRSSHNSSRQISIDLGGFHGVCFISVNNEKAKKIVVS